MNIESVAKTAITESNETQTDAVKMVNRKTGTKNIKKKDVE